MEPVVNMAGTNLSEASLSLSIGKCYFVSEEKCMQILQEKQTFLHFQNSKVCHFSCVDPELAASWIRSRKYGVDTKTKELKYSLDPESIKRVLNENRMLIEITKPLFQSFQEIALSSSYSMVLIDKNGVLILREGTIMESSTVLTPAVGTIWNENDIGTTSYSLSMQLKQPVQLPGWLHYCEIFQNVISSVVPILNENSDIVGSLVLVQPMMNPPWEEHFQHMCLHTLCLIVAMAKAVESKLKLQNNYNNLKAAHSALKETLALFEEGIITIDHTGKIIDLNRESAVILKKNAELLKNSNIMDFLGQSPLLKLVLKGENTDIEETIRSGDDEQSYLINIRPFFDKDTGEVSGAVLKITHMSKINAIVAKKTGVNARYRFQDIIGDSQMLSKAIEVGKRFADTSENILLIGESGTGKELFAQAIHNWHTPHGPFIAVNCAAMPRNLIESELFGYEKGSFTGAERSGRPGKIELANEGTLFLDEIGDMPFELQAVLLRVLEDKQVMRVGGQSYKKINFRLIAATNKNLSQMVSENLFREDLYFRISVLSIELPPLRQRKNDIEILTRYFLKNYCAKMGIKVPQISPAALKKITEFNWPGNVRQLENALIYAVNAELGGVIEPEVLPEYIRSNNTAPSSGLDMIVGKTEKDFALRNLEKSAIVAALAYANNYVPLAAELLQIGKSTLYRKLKEYDIN